ncbi:hypothetical protein [Streptomyces sp. NPDC004267]|uniref:hypothetical protein n=1 Tax=Streptomyces sp. NPDC004267 TaxID=3364694 RepID=UPI0036B64D9B
MRTAAVEAGHAYKEEPLRLLGLRPGPPLFAGLAQGPFHASFTLVTVVAARH